VTIQWYLPPAEVVGLGMNWNTVLVASRAVRCTKAHDTTLTWSTVTVPINGATFRPDHIVLLAEHPAVVDVKDIYHCYAAGDDDIKLLTSQEHQSPTRQVSPRVTPKQVTSRSCAIFLKVLCSLSRSPLRYFNRTVCVLRGPTRLLTH